MTGAEEFMVFRLASLAAAAVLVVSSGCKGGARSACEDRVRAICAYEYQCCEDKERVEHEVQFSFFAAFLGYENSEGECVERTIAIQCSGSNVTDDSIAAGRQELDRADLDDCLQDMRDATDKCDINDFINANRKCSDAEITQPLVDNKDACALSDECKSGECEIDTDKDGVPENVNEDEGFAEGECKDLPGSGDSCPDFECSRDLFCNGGGKCEKLKGGGDDCADDEECESDFCNVDKCEDDGPESNLKGKDKFCEGRE